MICNRYELSSKYLEIQEASRLQDVLVNNLGNNLKDRGDGDLLEVGRVQWEVREDMAALGDLLLGHRSGLARTLAGARRGLLAQLHILCLSDKRSC